MKNTGILNEIPPINRVIGSANKIETTNTFVKNFSFSVVGKGKNGWSNQKCFFYSYINETEE